MQDRDRTRFNKIPTYATLINTKRVIPAADRQYFAVDAFFFHDLMKAFLENVAVDERWYMEKYPDLVEESKQSGPLDVRRHYALHGYYEHRMPHAIVVDEPWYRKTYPDVAAAIAKGVFDSAQGHFDQMGFREGRLPFPNFSPKALVEEGAGDSSAS